VPRFVIPWRNLHKHTTERPLLKQNYTKLSDENEARFQNWTPTQRPVCDMSNDDIDYDLRGYWLNGGYK
jgi:hypothetical protein